MKNHNGLKIHARKIHSNLPDKTSLSQTELLSEPTTSRGKVNVPSILGRYLRSQYKYDDSSSNCSNDSINHYPSKKMKPKKLPQILSVFNIVDKLLR